MNNKENLKVLLFSLATIILTVIFFRVVEERNNMDSVEKEVQVLGVVTRIGSFNNNNGRSATSIMLENDKRIYTLSANKTIALTKIGDTVKFTYGNRNYVNIVSDTFQNITLTKEIKQ